MKNMLLLVGFCLLVGMGAIQTNGQNTGTKTVQGWLESSYYTPVFCDGVMVDILHGGTLRVHYVIHYKNGMYKWETDQLKGEVTSNTGEVFQIRETDHYYFTDSWNLTWHYNLIGDMGTHYIGTLTYSYLTGEITIGQTVCH